MKRVPILPMCFVLFCCFINSTARAQVALRELVEKERLHGTSTIKAIRNTTAGRVYHPAEPTIDQIHDDTFDFPPATVIFQSHHDQSTTADNGSHTGSWTFHTSIRVTGNTAADTAVELGFENLTQLVDLAGSRINLFPGNLIGTLPPVSVDFLDSNSALIAHRELSAGSGPVSFDFPSAGPLTMFMDWNWSSGVLPAGNYSFDSTPLSINWNISPIPEPSCAWAVLTAIAAMTSRKKRSRR